MSGRSPRAAVAIAVVCGALAWTDARARDQQPAPFVLEDATVATIHAAFLAKQLTCVDLVRAYLKRIDAYDHKGPALNAILTVNPQALQLAEQMDLAFGINGMRQRPLHCIPVILKDNYDTADLPTTGGAKTLAASQPLQDAFVVTQLRNAGALILAKANLGELAIGDGTTVSSLGGQTRNPYDLLRTPGGSSGGTAAAIAANYGVLGTGTDTGQSIRSPASAVGLVGLRPTRGLLSRTGIIPFSPTQDEPGPITRTVEDAAKMLDVMAGYDRADPVTALGASRVPPTYTAFLDRNGFKGVRIGVLTPYVGTAAVHAEVTAAFEAARKTITDLGATVVNVTIPNLATLTANAVVFNYEVKDALDRYFAGLGPNAPVKSLDEFIARGEFHSSNRSTLLGAQAMRDPLNSGEYKDRLLRREELKRAVMVALAEQDLDVLMYPHQRRLVSLIGEPQLDRNGGLASSTGLPAIAFPGLFSAPTKSAPLGVPVGIELLGPDWSEPLLLKLAYAFEQNTRIRKPPVSTPPLK